MTDQTLVKIIRNGKVESIHSGIVVVVNGSGVPQAGIGDITYSTYLRSAAKPFQAYPLVANNGIDEFSFTEKELAVMCASHSAEPEHISLVDSILDKSGNTRDLLQCGPHEPGNSEAVKLLHKENKFPEQIHNNCSGKHAGMLALAKLNKADTSTYLSSENPVQKEIMNSVKTIANLNGNDIFTGIDGCSAPTFYIPLVNLAYMFAKLAQGENKYMEIIRNAMVQNPHLVGGTKRFDTLLMENTGGRFVSKTGAEGVQCVGIVDGGPRPECSGWGVVVKIIDGSARAKGPATIETLKQLGVLTKSDISALQDIYHPKIYNCSGINVGNVISSFQFD